MTKPMRLEVNCSTGEEAYIELTDTEIAELEVKAVEAAERKAAAEAEAQAKANAKASALDKLTALGLTEAEAAAIVNL